MKKRSKKRVPLNQKLERINREAMKRNGIAFEDRISQLYKFEVKFLVAETKKRINEWLSSNPNCSNCPEWVVVEAYNQHTFIIAEKLEQIEVPELWKINVNSSFKNNELVGDIGCYAWSLELPKMSFSDLLNGSKVVVGRGAGIKTRWKGLQNEIYDGWKEAEIPDSYDLIDTEVSLIVHARFKSISAFNEHRDALKLKAQANLINILRLNYEKAKKNGFIDE